MEQHGPPLKLVKKVVTMLQEMQSKMEAKESFRKFEYYCMNMGSTVSQNVAAANDKDATIPSDVEATIGQKTQHETDNATHKPDREDADQAIAEAKSTQDKNEPASTSAQIKPSANIAALKKTLAAMGEGATGGATDSGAAKDREARIVDREAQDLAADTTMFIDTTTQGESEVMGTLQSLVRPVQRTAFTARLEHQSQGLKHHHVLQWQSPTFL